MMESLLRDFRIAIRGLTRNPGFTAVAVLTLALGIGATTTVFSVVYGVLYRPLPFPQADRLVQIVQLLDNRDGGTHRAGLTFGQFFNLQEHATTLSAVGIFGPAPRTINDVPVPARLNGAGVAPGLFEGVGAQPLRGRVLRPGDNEPGAEPVVVLSSRTWRTHFGGREDIIGTRITLEDVPTRVVGIMPDSFTFPPLAGPSMSRNSAGELEDAPEFWIPGRRFEPARSSRGGFSIIQAHAVVKPGVTYERALAEVRSLIGPMPNGKVLPVELVNERVEMGHRTRPALLIFQLGIVLVLLIACVNVVNLLLTRAAGRRRELAVRLALGASRGRLILEGTAEAVVLSIAGGALGCLLAYGLTSALRTLPPHIFPRLRDIHVDGVVLGFALALSVGTGLIVGLVSALRVGRASVMNQLHTPASYNFSALPGARLRPSSLLVVGEIAAAVVLLVGGGLLVNSFVRLVSVDLGFDARDVVSFEVSLPKDRYPTTQSRQDFYRELSGALRGLPDVQAASAADYAVTGSPIGFYPLTIDGRLAATEESEISFRRVSPDYFRTLRIPVLEGREFRDEDWSPVASKVIVNQSFARQHFSNATAIGHRIQWSEWKDLEVIGVVADTRENADGKIQRAFYLPLETGGLGNSLAFLLRSRRAPGSVLAAARAVLGRVDQRLAPYDAASLEDVLAHSAASPRLYGLVSLWCALVALALAAIGLYGVLAHSVGSRTHEFGIRIALGAEARAVRWQVLRQGLILTIIGLAIGLAGSYASVQALTSLLFGVTARDMTTFTAATVLLVATAVIACLVPSIRATRVDPVVALRTE
jgi:putative ABC transport system permease protein